MNKIITLTMNLVVDKDTSVAGIVPNKKLRCKTPAYYAGGVTPATLHPGTQLCNKEDADNLYVWIEDNSVKKTKKIPKLI